MMEKEKNQGSASVAWFKLAELIARREREKALNVYRLLSHSLEDKAYAFQLEGDILWSLDDKAAVDRYKQAAFLYQKEKRWLDAAGICEHLYSQDPSNQDFLMQLLRLYALLLWSEKFHEKLNQLYDLSKKKIIFEPQLVAILRSVVSDVIELEGENGKIWLAEKIDSGLESLSSDGAAQIQRLLK
jgi:hypothetical protein